jgi:enoyl-CoA hydratase/carnithine racemase
MPRLTRFEEYRNRYPDYALEKTDDGILLMRMHRDGGPAVWDERMHHDTANVFNDVAGDRDVRVVIYTGTGENFNANWGQESAGPLQAPPVDGGDGLVRTAPAHQPAGDPVAIRP